MTKATPTITAPTNQQPETVTYFDKRYKKNVTVEMSVGMGATSSYNSDCYPHTIWGWHISKAGVLTVYQTSDRYQFERAANWAPSNQNGEFIYTSCPPTTNSPAGAVKMGTKHTRLSLGGRRFYNDPSF